MILLGDTLVSLEIFDNEFVCNLSDCKGACCVEGDYGAPLSAGEVSTIQKYIENIKPYMNEKGKRLLAKKGFSEEDPDGDLVTTCVSGRDCVFAIDENGVYKCAIEKAYENGDIDFRKPSSCHLYPIRLNQVGGYTALNYSRWDICSAACTLGKELKVPVYKFLKDALIARFGQEWYAELELVAQEYLRSKLPAA